MDYYDLIIVGAGPAGSTLASALENSGKKVLIIDKQNFRRLGSACRDGDPEH